ncbi:phosphotransferase [Devosia ginsengisoli]|uniref:Aminoglycoside phosphotransferase family protein n=1 Tax=Devosia ginsengisoli TaxID=400770 RepID=A0A5B8LUV4_9HYPH|nr:phosphotransferase [Devosia ginsengisoli]QDZ11619.1 aminoglycoside phosphotransferase family protein [Devosia ginsengisoli]
MSSSELFREPSWRGLRPALPEYVAAEPAVTDFICRTLGEYGAISQLLLGGCAVGMFRFQPAGGDAKLVKLVPESRRSSMMQAEDIATWLAARDAPVVAALPGYPVWDGDYGIVVMPYLHGRRVEASEQDMALLGRSVAQVQKKLASHPDRLRWERATAERLADLMVVRSSLATGRLSCGPNPERLATLARDPMLDFVLQDMERVPLHGDLNPGNVLIVDGKAILLDLEDVFHSVLPPILELVLAIERYVLVVVENDAHAVSAGRAFVKAWQSNMGVATVTGSTDLVRVFRSLALRSLCVLASAEQHGAAMPDEEWNKFFLLEQLAGRRAHAIALIFEEGVA